MDLGKRSIVKVALLIQPKTKDLSITQLSQEVTLAEKQMLHLDPKVIINRRLNFFENWFISAILAINIL